jgi:predicted small integral membrane protein
MIDFNLTWMAWTWPTAAFFVFVFGSIAAMGVWEYFDAGGNPRRGVLGLRTTRGDRLFISLLGSAYILLGWLALFGMPLWGAGAVCLAYTVIVFRYV